MRAVCSSGDWLMVSYTQLEPAMGAAADAPALVKKEGWMLLRSPVRVLMVAVQDPAALFDLSQSEESPVPIPGGDSPGGGGAGGGALGAGRKEDSDDSDEEEMTPAQRKELKQAMRELRAEKKNAKKKKRRGGGA